MILVVKVGGSLLQWPHLGQALRLFCSSMPVPILMVAGGGKAADLVREWDKAHGLGDEKSHWLAIEAMALNGRLLKSFDLGDTVEHIDPVNFMRQDDRREDRLPHTWEVTSDAIAARIAVRRKASVLQLLKAAAPPPGDVTAWAAAGYVDPWLPKIVAASGLKVVAKNWLAGTGQ